MKELTIEQKAKRYDEAIRESGKIIDFCTGGANIPECVSVKATIEHIFPKLKESEDERMIQYFKDLAPFDKADELYEKYGFSHKDAIAWLEKQWEHSNFLSKIQVGDKVTRNKDGVLVNLSQPKRIAKPAEEHNITGIGSKSAQGKLGEMIKNLKPVNEVLEHESAWSEKYIADVFEKVGLAKIAREQSNDSLTNALQDAMIELSKFLPQHNLAWSEEDKKIWEEISDMLWEGYRQSCSKLTWDNIRDWIKQKIEYFKDRTQPKQEWSEEDEKVLDGVITNYESGYLPSVEKRDEIIEKLKSLKERCNWKPSDEQMQALSNAGNSFRPSEEGHKILWSLYNDLKKLMEY